MPSKVLLILAALFAIASWAIWIVFLRPVPAQLANGRITNKTLKPAGTYWQYPPGMNRGFRLATPIPVEEADVFEIALDGFDGPIFFSLNTVAGREFAVGQNVSVSYQERVIPFLTRRVYVMDMKRR